MYFGHIVPYYLLLSPSHPTASPFPLPNQSFCFHVFIFDDPLSSMEVSYKSVSLGLFTVAKTIYQGQQH